MGANTSKYKFKSTTESSELLNEKRLQMKSFFNIDSSNKDEITRDKVKEIWCKYLTTDLLSALIDTIFDNKTAHLDFENFFKFYFTMCEEHDCEKEAEIFLQICKEICGLSIDLLKLEYLVVVVSEFIQSYITIICMKNNLTLSNLLNSKKTDPSVSILSKYVTEDLISIEINKETINLWLMRTPFFHLLLHYTFKTIFNTLYDSSNSPFIPSLIHKSNYDTVLSMADILFLQWHVSTSKKWRLLYSLEYDGQSWATFLKAIIGQGPTIIIIYDVNGYCFGAHASKSWNINPNFYGDENSFLFTLRPTMNVYESSGYNGNFQYINTGQNTLPNGLGMGGLLSFWGLFIDADFGKGTVSESCTTFKRYKKLSLEKEFKIDNLEVWGIGEPDPTPEELGERSTSCLDKDPAAAAILELAGRPLHSTEIRKMKHIDDE